MSKCAPPPLTLKIVERRLDELRVEGRAVRRHSVAQIEAIAASIRQFGFLDPLLVDESDAVIVGKAKLQSREMGLNRN
jgi:ParB family transcriptional regulator, chromosome partitioning protein